jgi:hypothetical protein
MSTATTYSSTRRSWPRLQFSLRLLLLALTAFSVGFPIWYHWPYEEPVERRAPKGRSAQTITTWQRQWGGGRLKHGVERQVRDGRTVETTTYRSGLRHGLHEQGAQRGQYVDDMKEGVWTEPNRTATWHKGKLNGPYEVHVEPPQFSTTPPRYWAKAGDTTWKPPQFESRTYRLVFSAGEVTEINGKSVSSRLFDLLESGPMNDKVRKELKAKTNIETIEMPLKDVAAYLSDTHNISIALDPTLGLRASQPITCEYHSLDLATILTLITAEYDLACDYRFGGLWFTTPEDVKEWRDPTGVAEVRPAADSAFARNGPDDTIFVQVNNALLVDVLGSLAQNADIAIDMSRIEPAATGRPAISVTVNQRNLAIRDVLGHLLYQTGCRCRLEGETLVILPPED